MTTPPPGSRRAERAATEAAARARSGRATGGGRRRARKPPSRWRTARRVLLSLVALGIIGPVVAFMVAYLLVDVPRPSDLRTNQVATIFYADAATPLSTVVPEEGNRTDVRIDQVPQHVRDAVLSAEDRSFYSNPGFSVTGILRATANNVRGGDPQGASTITQQYVKNALVGSDPTLTRKMRELVVSTKMARQSSKDEILAAYLNTIYFGRGAYGVSAAAGAYFGKPVEQLTVAEGAVLASSIRSPSALDPETDPQPATDRWNYVLDGMSSEGWLPQAERDAQVYPTVVPLAEVTNGSTARGPEGLIVRQVRQELATSGISEQQLNTEGLQITTTIDAVKQQAALTSTAVTLEGQPPDLRTGLVSLDPRTGAVRAYYGGADGTGIDYAQSENLQPGSSFKVFALTAALQQGIPLSERYDGSSPQTIAGTEISNSEGASCGSCTLAEALKRSLNTVYFRLGVDVGGQAVADAAHAAGVPATFPTSGAPTLQNPDGSAPAPTIALGSYSARIIDMAGTYATLANNGLKMNPYFVQKVVTADGTVLLDRGAPAGEQTIDPAVAQNVTSAMEPIAGYSREHDLADGRASASKTGTAQLGDSGNNRDAWMVGYTPSLSTAVWIGTDAGTAIQNATGGDVYGSGLPSDIWQSYMDAALAGTPEEEFPAAPPIAGQDRGGVPDGGGSNSGGSGSGNSNGDAGGGNRNGGGSGGGTQAPPRRTSEAPAPEPTTGEPAPTTVEPAPTTTEPPPPAPSTSAPLPTTAAPEPTTTATAPATTSPSVPVTPVPGAGGGTAGG